MPSRRGFYTSRSARAGRRLRIRTERPQLSRTAIGVLVLASKEKNSAEFEGLRVFAGRATGNHYYQCLYYGAQAYFHASTTAWRKWNMKNITALSGTQNKTGSWDGPFGSTFATVHACFRWHSTTATSPYTNADSDQSCG